MLSAKKIVISGGGTGGHIYPGIAIAKEIQKLDSQIEIHFVGTQKGLESKVVPREGFILHTISVGQLNKNAGIFRRLKTLLILPWSLIQSFHLCLKLRPQAILGVGGYASGPFLLVACILGRKTAIWEPNAIPGLANRWLAKWVDTSFVVFSEAKKMLPSQNVVNAGMPVRFELGENRHENAAFHLLVFGGSQGARAINNVVVEAVERGGEWLRSLKIIHQTGPGDYQRIKAQYAKMPEDIRQQVEVCEFLYDMKERYAWADLVLCRAGASTLAEIAACGKAAILVPFPGAADNHQQKNAEELEKLQAAQMILQKDFTVEEFVKTVRHWRENTQKLRKYCENVRKFHHPKAANEIAQWLLR